MVPLCRVWLRDVHLKNDFKRSLRQAMFRELADGSMDAASSATDMLVFLLQNIAHSNAVLLAGKMSTQDRSQFWNIVRVGRASFQRLCEAAILAMSMSGRCGRLKPQIPSQPTSRAPSVDSAASEDAMATASKKKKQYMQNKAVPNVHIGHHYGDVLDRYGLVSLLTVFAGEQKHK